MNTDHYDDCIKQLYLMMVKLSGGYYEPRSERDANLARQIFNLLDNQHDLSSPSNN